ncbi:arsenate reductase (glutaredoxin) [Nitrincola tapanii]|uniref:Arsenate reductase n=1 Tax=Nitrincola tapanii TaxID=1708751 RepID=A0A5A9W706_9GAMM|nr:arsenate reductase (glutaredoxin) [Nitrincola tapanii]KAA0875799.1 arsenate reductase (glutaredoxin) [Nitrincola tapanii]
MSQYLLYHNPRCSKSRQALELLREHGIEPEICEYLKTPPDLNTLRQLMRALGMAPSEVLRRKEVEFVQAGLDQGPLDDETVLHALAQYPKLLERPILVKDQQARIGRPPEALLELLEQTS